MSGIKELQEWEHKYKTYTALRNVDRLTVELYLLNRQTKPAATDEATTQRRVNACRKEAETILECLARRRHEAETGAERTPAQPDQVDEAQAKQDSEGADDLGGSDVLLQGHDSGGEEGEHPAPEPKVGENRKRAVGRRVVKNRRRTVRPEHPS